MALLISDVYGGQVRCCDRTFTALSHVAGAVVLRPVRTHTAQDLAQKPLDSGLNSWSRAPQILPVCTSMFETMREDSGVNGRVSMMDSATAQL